MTGREDIADLLVRYATGIDTRDWDLFRTCFTPDYACDYGGIGGWRSVDEVTRFMQKSHDGQADFSVSRRAILL